jgi:hypothetical protein
MPFNEESCCSRTLITCTAYWYWLEFYIILVDIFCIYYCSLFTCYSCNNLTVVIYFCWRILFSSSSFYVITNFFLSYRYSSELGRLIGWIEIYSVFTFSNSLILAENFSKQFYRSMSLYLNRLFYYLSRRSSEYG